MAKRMTGTAWVLLAVLAAMWLAFAIWLYVGTPYEPDPGLTSSYMQIIIGAVHVYNDVTGSVPAEPEDYAPAPAWFTGHSDEEWRVYCRSAALYSQLVDVEKSLNTCAKLPIGATAIIEEGPAAFVDSWGHYMDYQPQGDFGGPLIISAGQDGRFGTEDDYRSDGR